MGANESAGSPSAATAVRGRLELFVGFAPGVGKTTRLLERARDLAAAGRRVVVGFADARGTSGPSSLLDGLEVVPLRRIEHRGLAVEEMDLEEVLRRRPEFCVVDDVPHTNAPGSAHLRRHLDVEALLDAGVSVLTALDVERIESVAALVRSTLGRPVRETVPDGFVRRADEIVCLDLPIEEYVARVRAAGGAPSGHAAGRPATPPAADELRTLRELALREVAERLAAQRDSRRAGTGASSAQQVSNRVLVCLSSESPRAGAMLRRGARIAGRLNADWFAVHVGSRVDSGALDADAQRTLVRSSALAQDLGAEVHVLPGPDPVAAVLDFARSHGVGHVIVGRSSRGAVVRALRRTFVDRLLAAAHDLDVQVVAADTPEDAA